MVGLIVGSVVIGILLLLTIIVLAACIIRKEWKDIIMGSIYIIILTIFEILLILDMQNTQPEPTAIEVYRGLTELEITTVNGVPTDTVVVFKK